MSGWSYSCISSIKVFLATVAMAEGGVYNVHLHNIINYIVSSGAGVVLGCRTRASLMNDAAAALCRCACVAARIGNARC